MLNAYFLIYSYVASTVSVRTLTKKLIRYEMNNLKLTKEEKNNINLIEKLVSSTGVIYKEDIGDMKKEIEHSSSKSTMEDLYKICKNHGIYIGNGNGEIIFLSSFFLLDYANKKTPMYPLRPHQP